MYVVRIAGITMALETNFNKAETAKPKRIPPVVLGWQHESKSAAKCLLPENGLGNDGR